MPGNSDMRDAIFFAFADAKYPIVSMSIEEASLESIFLRLTSSDDKKSKKYKISSVKSAEDGTDIADVGGEE